MCKAEHLKKGSDTRFVVTSLKHGEYDAKTLYEDVYCARGEMENRIKAQQLDMFSDRTSTHYMMSNQLRMYFSAFACVLLECLRRSGFRGTGHYKAQCGTISVKLLKVGVVIRQSARRILLSFAQGYPYAELFRHALGRLRTIPLAA